ncbi:MAG: hypothetical protein HFJ93_00425 [Muribaculaceae bacterium]|nr:hypothetical protein [Muribaculaceae bacterium]
MKTIPRIPLDDAKVLTPADMNKIHFATGLHSTAQPASATGATTVPSATTDKATKQPAQ